MRENGSAGSYQTASRSVLLTSGWQQINVQHAAVGGTTGMDVYVMQANAKNGNAFIADDFVLTVQ